MVCISSLLKLKGYSLQATKQGADPDLFDRIVHHGVVVIWREKSLL